MANPVEIVIKMLAAEKLRITASRLNCLFTDFAGTLGKKSTFRHQSSARGSSQASTQSIARPGSRSRRRRARNQALYGAAAIS
jgi:hypothetical protein